jgi:class 3 adenylate cyclase/tetratricopeptide (TPR) repeat protein
MEPDAEIDGWLRRIGLEQYSQTFHDNGVDLSVLPDLTDQDLEKLGLLLGHRRKVLRAIADLEANRKTATAVATATPVSPRQVDTAERRQLTVMFCDLVGSTALSTRLDPEDMREIIGSYHRCCADLIARAGGFVARYMGDGVLAYFGYPQAHEHDAERAVRAGLGLVDAVPKLKTAVGDPLQVRVGIATGLVVVGDLIDTGATREQAVVGETPNLASRLQTLAEPGTVVISSSTRKLTGGLFDYRDLGTVALKGFAQDVPAWQVLGVSNAESRFEALRASTIPLVGRDEEVDLLIRRWAQAKGGEGSVVLLSGEPGIGKSRIVQTLLEQVSGEPHTRLRLFCSPHHQDTALHPAITQLERTAGFRREDTDNQRLAKLETLLGLATNDLGEAVSLLAALLSVETGDRYPPLDLTPQKRKERTLQALASQVEGLAARQPVLLVAEDAHWADPTSLELFELIVGRASSLPVLAIVTCRPEFVPPWHVRPEVTQINLNRLPRRLCAEMITHVTGGKPLPHDIAEQITDRTDGVPLFIEELTKAVVESGLLVEAGGRYVATGQIAPPVIPTSLQESLLARLDRLAPTSEVAQIAAALGREFSHDLISAVATMPQQQLDYALAQLVNAELIFRRGTPPDAEYIFKHALVQDTAYGTLLRGRRQQIHSRIAATIEERFPEIVVAQPAMLARHCTEAGLVERAVAYWLKAGRQALARSAAIEAAAQLRKGLKTLDGFPDGPARRQQELDLQLALGLALMAMKGYSAPEVGETLARARALAEQIDRPEYLWPVFLGQSSFHRVRGEHRQALTLAEELEEIGKARNDVAAQLVGRWANGRTRLFLGDFVAAKALLERCQGLADPAHRGGVSFADPYAMMLAYLAWSLAILGFIDQARSRLEEALSEARSRRHGHTLVDVLLAASTIESIIGSPHMQTYTEELFALANDRGLPLHLGWATVYRGASLAALGREQDGVALISEGLTGIRATGAVTGTPNLLMILAEAYARLGRPAEGLNCLAETAQIIEKTEERSSEAEMYRLRGDLLNAIGDRSASERSYHQAIALAKLQSAKLFELRASLRLARLWCEWDRRGEARDLLAPICGWFTEGFDAPDLKQASTLLEQVSTARART